jgi:glucan phosphoethanolaminetransferase (alkaline phosphatase superfamily)
MWQRIQTVFLGLVVLSMVVSLFLPLWKVVEGTKELQLFPLHFSTIENGARTTQYFPYSLTAILMVAAATIAVMEIRRFDNRLTQIKLGTLNSLILAGALGSAVYFFSQVSKQYQAGPAHLPPALWVMFIGVACNWLAVRFIRRDEKLVRDSDQLR